MFAAGHPFLKGVVAEQLKGVAAVQHNVLLIWMDCCLLNEVAACSSKISSLLPTRIAASVPPAKGAAAGQQEEIAFDLKL